MNQWWYVQGWVLVLLALLGAFAYGREAWGKSALCAIIALLVTLCQLVSLKHERQNTRQKQ